jgi:hypothetical protein
VSATSATRSRTRWSSEVEPPRGCPNGIAVYKKPRPVGPECASHAISSNRHAHTSDAAKATPGSRTERQRLFRRIMSAFTALFPSGQAIPEHAREFGVQVTLSQLRLDEFWRDRLLSGLIAIANRFRCRPRIDALPACNLRCVPGRRQSSHAPILYKTGKPKKSPDTRPSLRAAMDHTSAYTLPLLRGAD